MNVVKTTFDQIAMTLGYAQKARTWYKRSEETIRVLELQKSQYDMKHYINMGVFVRSLEPEKAFPKENECHVRGRAQSLNHTGREASTLALDASSPLSPEERRRTMSELLHIADASLTRLATLDGIRDEALSGRGDFLISRRAKAIVGAP